MSMPAYAGIYFLQVRMEAEPQNSYIKGWGHGCGSGIQRFIRRTLPMTTLIKALISDGASLYFPKSLGVAFPHSYLQEDKG